MERNLLAACEAIDCVLKMKVWRGQLQEIVVERSQFVVEQVVC
jgi:hypothetical protein